MINRFWWDQRGEGKKIHWMSWGKLSKIKSLGGMGFRDTSHFNLAFLYKA